MQLTCPECHVECTIDEQSALTATCPGCGVVLYSKSGWSGPLAAQIAMADGQNSEVAEVDLERTRQWKQAVDQVLPIPDLFPQRLGRYELRQKLGEGSFAEVYLAFDSELTREVALKIPRRNRFGSVEHLRRFLDEARTSAILEHPGIVRVYDIGWISEDVCFISMEYCSGGSLSDLIKSESLTCDRAVEVVESLAEAIHFAHLHGFVHRDLKPSNVMLGRDGKARIVDFGLALSDEEQLKHIGEIAGTFPYMSPEQIRGDTHHLDGRTDIWSLGVVLYQLLVGRRPFSGTQKQISDQIRNREAKPPRQIKDDVPVELEAICLRCLQKSPADRYPTAKDLAHDLHVFRQRDTLNPLPATSAPMASPRRHHLRPIVFTGLALLGIGVAFGVMRRNPEQLSTAGKPNVQGTSILESTNLALAPTGVWQPLLLTKPRVFHWNDNYGGPWSYDAATQRVTMDSISEGILELGDVPSSDFEFSVDLLKSTWTSGGAGILWGIRDVKPDPKRPLQAGAVAGIHATEFTFNAVFVPGMPLTYQVGICEVEFWSHPDGRITSQSDSIAESECQPPTISRASLRIELSKRGPTRLVWDGESLDKLVDTFNRNRPAQYQSNGRLALINFKGSTTFRGAQVQLLKKGLNDGKGKSH